jgi:hypothetical protein
LIGAYDILATIALGALGHAGIAEHVAGLTWATAVWDLSDVAHAILAKLLRENRAGFTRKQQREDKECDCSPDFGLPGG